MREGKIKILNKEKLPNGKRKISLFGKKIFSYKRNVGKSNKNSKLALYNEYKNKFSKAGWNLTKDNDEYLLSNGTIKVKGTADNTLWTGFEVFVNDEYSFYDTSKYIMIDVGLNLGFTSLRMATENHITQIYGFEPFSPTYKLAKRNMELNPALSQKIKTFNFGLGEKDKILEIHYNPDLPGSMSSIKDRFKECSAVEKIVIKDASSVLKPIIEQSQNKVFFKIDCEGAEKEIIPNLQKSGLLKKIDLISMEWHFESPKYLIDILMKEGFVITCSHSTYNDLGKIIAFKK